MILHSKAVVLVAASFLLVILIYSSSASFEAFGRMKNYAPNQACVNGGLQWNIYTHGYAWVKTCCWKNTIVDIGTTSCQQCYYGTPDSEATLVTCGPVYDLSNRPGGGLNPPASVGNALPPPSNNTGTPPLGSIFKVPPGTTNAFSPTGNNTGVSPSGNNTSTLPAQTITKEHNPASPNILNLARNTTNPNNSTGPVKLSPLTTITSGGHHHHKGGSTSSSNTNSTGH